MGILALSAIIMAGTGFMLFFQSVPNFRPGRRKIQTDLKFIRDEVLKISGDLAPVRKEDLELLSLREVQRKDKKWMVRNVQGVLQVEITQSAQAIAADMDDRLPAQPLIRSYCFESRWPKAGLGSERHGLVCFG